MPILEAVLRRDTNVNVLEFLLPAATQLNYWGSGNADNGSENMKCGPSRKRQPIDELFMTLYRLHCNILEKDIGNCFGLGSSTVSYIGKNLCKIECLHHYQQIAADQLSSYLVLVSKKL